MVHPKPLVILNLMNLRCAPLLVVLGLASCALDESQTAPEGRDVLPKAEVRVAKKSPDFTKHVKPILEAKCVACHTRAAQPGGVSLASREQAVKTGMLGRVIMPGRPELSPLFLRFDSAHAGLGTMPAVGERLSQNEIAILTQWVKLGANWPGGAAGTLTVR